MRTVHLYHCLFLIILSASCKKETERSNNIRQEGEKLELKYAKGFTAIDYGSYKILEVTKPWPNSETSYKYRIQSDNTGLDLGTGLAGVVKSPIENIVVTSTTHIPGLELLGVEEYLTGFPGTDYISSLKTRKRIKQGSVRELGKNEGINTEVLLEINPDVVIGFGVDGVNKSFEIIKKTGIPVIYNGDWVEDSALAKAEWIKFFGVLFNMEAKADSIFNSIELNYLEAKKIALNAKTKPTILSGAMHKDVWYLPNGQSAEAQFLRDANTHYIWKNTQSEGSLALSFEVVFDKAKNANIWLSPSYYRSYEQLQQASDLYTNFEAFKNRQVYTFSNNTGETGGVLYYELGTSRPDLVLKDLIKIAHPNMLTDYKLNFFAPLKTSE